ncbi:hypothetical protein Hanom_Chr08g00737911 [Helianthus anomalus]
MMVKSFERPVPPCHTLIFQCLNCPYARSHQPRFYHGATAHIICRKDDQIGIGSEIFGWLVIGGVWYIYVICRYGVGRNA